jgi:hypothetical protein
MRSLTITYFHTGIRTIIGVESFHGPVRDGKGWYQLAMVIRHKGGVQSRAAVRLNQSGEEVVEFTLCVSASLLLVLLWVVFSTGTTLISTLGVESV